jgi:preprotein translocase subunit SecA
MAKFSEIFSKILQVGEGKRQKRLEAIVPFINDLEPEFQKLSDLELRGKTEEFKKRLKEGQTLEDILVEAFATVREAAKRVIGQRHFDVQLMGGMALHFGWIAEMKTGEGKTLVSTLPAYLNALTGKGVHIVTVNDYLAKRDSEWMGKIHRFLGLTVGLISPGITEHSQRKQAYLADITYGTNSEFGFDYLRDNMAMRLESLVQRGHYYAIVDEVDSILIDEARTPLIISGPAGAPTQIYYQFASIAASLTRDVDYEVEEDKNLVIPTEAGIEKVEKILGVKNLYDDVSTNLVHQLIKALEAKELKKRDRDYVVIDGEVKIVDEFTHRILEGRRWEEGLHQAIEAKERLKIKEENHTLATITLQNYFRMYEKLAGMTGTAKTEAAEFANTYNMAVVPIPTNLPMIRKDWPDVIYKTEAGKFKAVVEDIKRRYEKGQPVLIGTASIEKSEILSRMLEKEGIEHYVLNAKHHFKEAEIVAQAGRKHAVTVSTNMAGRGVDILLGGNPEGLARKEMVSKGVNPDLDENQEEFQRLVKKYEEICKKEGDEVRALGGLYVLGSERHESRRIDDQLRGRAGRQGDPGESRFYLSFEDELLRLFATGAVNWVMSKTLPEDLPLEGRVFTRAIEKAQHAVEARNSEIRKEVLKYDEVMNEQRKVIYKRRMEILKGEDLREYTEDLIVTTINKLTNEFCKSDYPEEWDLESLLNAISQYYPTQIKAENLNVNSIKELQELLVDDAINYYQMREETLPGKAEMLRDIEREVMLQVIDMHWREHLADMDYLRTGINLRAMGQQDPLVAWQKDGFEMFENMMRRIEQDYLKYVFHIEYVPERQQDRALEQASFTGGESSRSVEEKELVAVGSKISKGPKSLKAVKEIAKKQRAPRIQQGNVSQIVKSNQERIGRNDPCWCNSGKKYKYCHGR